MKFLKNKNLSVYFVALILIISVGIGLAGTSTASSNGSGFPHFELENKILDEAFIKKIKGHLTNILTDAKKDGGKDSLYKRQELAESTVELFVKVEKLFMSLKIGENSKVDKSVTDLIHKFDAKLLSFLQALSVLDKSSNWAQFCRMISDIIEINVNIFSKNVLGIISDLAVSEMCFGFSRLAKAYEELVKEHYGGYVEHVGPFASSSAENRLPNMGSSPTVSVTNSSVSVKEDANAKGRVIFSQFISSILNEDFREIFSQSFANIFKHVRALDIRKMKRISVLADPFLISELELIELARLVIDLIAETTKASVYLKSHKTKLSLTLENAVYTIAYQIQNLDSYDKYTEEGLDGLVENMLENFANIIANIIGVSPTIGSVLESAGYSDSAYFKNYFARNSMNILILYLCFVKDHKGTMPTRPTKVFLSLNGIVSGDEFYHEDFGSDVVELKKFVKYKLPKVFAVMTKVTICDAEAEWLSVWRPSLMNKIMRRLCSAIDAVIYATRNNYSNVELSGHRKDVEKLAYLLVTGFSMANDETASVLHSKSSGVVNKELELAVNSIRCGIAGYIKKLMFTEPSLFGIEDLDRMVSGFYSLACSVLEPVVNELHISYDLCLLHMTLLVFFTNFVKNYFEDYSIGWLNSNILNFGRSLNNGVKSIRNTKRLLEIAEELLIIMEEQADKDKYYTMHRTMFERLKEEYSRVKRDGWPESRQQKGGYGIKLEKKEGKKGEIAGYSVDSGSRSYKHRWMIIESELNDALNEALDLEKEKTAEKMVSIMPLISATEKAVFISLVSSLTQAFEIALGLLENNPKSVKEVANKFRTLIIQLYGTFFSPSLEMMVENIISIFDHILDTKTYVSNATRRDFGRLLELYSSFFGKNFSPTKYSKYHEYLSSMTDEINVSLPLSTEKLLSAGGEKPVSMGLSPSIWEMIFIGKDAPKFGTSNLEFSPADIFEKVNAKEDLVVTVTENLFRILSAEATKAQQSALIPLRELAGSVAHLMLILNWNVSELVNEQIYVSSTFARNALNLPHFLFEIIFDNGPKRELSAERLNSVLESVFTTIRCSILMNMMLDYSLNNFELLCIFAEHTLYLYRNFKLECAKTIPDWLSGTFYFLRSTIEKSRLKIATTESERAKKKLLKVRSVIFSEENISTLVMRLAKGSKSPVVPRITYTEENISLFAKIIARLIAVMVDTTDDASISEFYRILPISTPNSNNFDWLINIVFSCKLLLGEDIQISGKILWSQEVNTLLSKEQPISVFISNVEKTRDRLRGTVINSLINKSSIDGDSLISDSPVDGDERGAQLLYDYDIEELADMVVGGFIFVRSLMRMLRLSELVKPEEREFASDTENAINDILTLLYLQTSLTLDGTVGRFSTIVYGVLDKLGAKIDINLCYILTLYLEKVVHAYINLDCLSHNPPPAWLNELNDRVSGLDKNTISPSFFTSKLPRLSRLQNFFKNMVAPFIFSKSGPHTEKNLTLHEWLEANKKPKVVVSVVPVTLTSSSSGPVGFGEKHPILRDELAEKIESQINTIVKDFVRTIVTKSTEPLNSGLVKLMSKSGETFDKFILRVFFETEKLLYSLLLLGKGVETDEERTLAISNLVKQFESYANVLIFDPGKQELDDLIYCIFEFAASLSTKFELERKYMEQLGDLVISYLVLTEKYRMKAAGWASVAGALMVGDRTMNINGTIVNIVSSRERLIGLFSEEAVFNYILGTIENTLASSDEVKSVARELARVVAYLVHIIKSEVNGVSYCLFNSILKNLYENSDRVRKPSCQLDIFVKTLIKFVIPTHGLGRKNLSSIKATKYWVAKKFILFTLVTGGNLPEWIFNFSPEASSFELPLIDHINILLRSHGVCFYAIYVVHESHGITSEKQRKEKEEGKREEEKKRKTEREKEEEKKKKKKEAEEEKKKKEKEERKERRKEKNKNREKIDEEEIEEMERKEEENKRKKEIEEMERKEEEEEKRKKEEKKRKEEEKKEYEMKIRKEAEEMERKEEEKKRKKEIEEMERKEEEERERKIAEEEEKKEKRKERRRKERAGEERKKMEEEQKKIKEEEKRRKEMEEKEKKRKEMEERRKKEEYRKKVEDEQKKIEENKKKKEMERKERKKKEEEQRKMKAEERKKKEEENGKKEKEKSDDGSDIEFGGVPDNLANMVEIHPNNSQNEAYGSDDGQLEFISSRPSENYDISPVPLADVLKPILLPLTLPSSDNLLGGQSLSTGGLGLESNGSAGRGLMSSPTPPLSPQSPFYLPPAESPSSVPPLKSPSLMSDLYLGDLLWLPSLQEINYNPLSPFPLPTSSSIFSPLLSSSSSETNNGQPSSFPDSLSLGLGFDRNDYMSLGDSQNEIPTGATVQDSSVNLAGGQENFSNVDGLDGVNYGNAISQELPLSTPSIFGPDRYGGSSFLLVPPAPHSQSTSYGQQNQTPAGRDEVNYEGETRSVSMIVSQKLPLPTPHTFGSSEHYRSSFLPAIPPIPHSQYTSYSQKSRTPASRGRWVNRGWHYAGHGRSYATTPALQRKTEISANIASGPSGVSTNPNPFIYNSSYSQQNRIQPSQRQFIERGYGRTQGQGGNLNTQSGGYPTATPLIISGHSQVVVNLHNESETTDDNVQQVENDEQEQNGGNNSSLEPHVRIPVPRRNNPRRNSSRTNSGGAFGVSSSNFSCSSYFYYYSNSKR